MSLLVILGIWIAVSAVLTPLVGYFLSGASRRAAERRTSKEIDTGLHPGTPPPA
jgi:hypothetical protein